MKTILVPTDFSNNAETALHFAMLVAQKLNAKLIIVNAYEMPAAAAPVSFQLMELEKKEYKSTVNKKLMVVEQQLKHVNGIRYETVLKEGQVLDVLLGCIQEQKADLVIMGTKGAGAFSGAIFGSTTSNLMAKTDCPVMAIPFGVKFNADIKRMTYATDYKTSDIHAIDKLVEFARLFHSQINVLHISGDEIEPEEEKNLMSDFMNKVNKKIEYNNISFQILHGNDVEEKLEQHMAEGSTDMMVMATHYRGLMDRLFGRSITKEVVLETTVPLLAFHYSKAPEIKIYS